MRVNRYAIYPLWPDEVEKVDDMAFAKLRAIHYAEKYGVPIAIKELPYTPRLDGMNGELAYYIDSMGVSSMHPPRSIVKEG